MKFMLAYDGSEFSDRALERVLAIIQNQPEEGEKHSLTVVTVANELPPIDVFTEAAELEEINQKKLEQARKMLEERVAPTLSQTENNTKNPLHYSLEVLQDSDPRECLLRYVQEHDVDCCVVGSRGLSGLDRVFGSVTRYLLSYATCSLLIIK
ncbi:hypothetical protein QOT17_003145 [Balamuthia mandrillaris]